MEKTNQKQIIMTKEEIIKEAWGELFEKYEDRISLEDGYLHYKSSKVLKEVQSVFQNVQFMPGGGVSIFRPKSLQGIERNNGWIALKGIANEIVCDSDIWIINQLGVIEYYEYGMFLEIGYATHYQPIEKPKPPVH